jgi:hypothetical protein
MNDLEDRLRQLAALAADAEKVALAALNRGTSVRGARALSIMLPSIATARAAADSAAAVLKHCREIDG